MRFRGGSTAWAAGVAEKGGGSSIPISKWARQRLRVTDEHLDALQAACAEFVERDLVLHVKGCDTCTATMLKSGSLFSTWTIARITDWERLIALAEPGAAAHRFTTYRPCEVCGAEIYGTRMPGQRGPFWANRLDHRLHSCADFRRTPVVVELWRSTPGSRRGGGRAKGWRWEA